MSLYQINQSMHLIFTLLSKDCLPEAAKQLSSIPRKLTGGVPGEDNDRES